MSEAGVRSSIGDDYQDMLAVWWLAKMLTDEALRSIDVESTSLINCERVRVDDVIIHKNDSIICCQCKVDHPRRETWNVTDLKDDLCKAWKHWQSIPESEIYFYSTGPFGGLAVNAHCKGTHHVHAKVTHLWGLCARTQSGVLTRGGREA